MKTNIEIFKKEKQALLIGDKKCTEIEAKNCPQNGDPTDCSSCVYGPDYTFVDDGCINRHVELSKWIQLRIEDPVKEEGLIKIGIIGWLDYVLSQKESISVAEVWIDTNNNEKGMVYTDGASMNDCYTLSVVIDALRELDKYIDSIKR